MTSTAATETLSVAPERPALGRWGNVGVVALRVLTALFLLDTLLQAALAGLFVTGDVALLTWHAANAQLLGGLSVLACAAAVLAWRAARTSGWAALAAVALMALVNVQHGLGESRQLGGHIPLGMTIFGLAAALTFWAFTSPRTSREEAGR
ncbi:hypothetical protein [Streptomyces sp. NPDC048623]|uniref:hypothetical protein n=1 Tax=Streptomyces sp. NPDC048623 TaxID=3155761 RepID=UPI00342F9B7C